MQGVTRLPFSLCHTNAIAQIFPRKRTTMKPRDFLPCNCLDFFLIFSHFFRFALEGRISNSVLRIFLNARTGMGYVILFSDTSGSLYIRTRLYISENSSACTSPSGSALPHNAQCVVYAGLKPHSRSTS